MSNLKPEIYPQARPAKICPVCQKSSYSSAGIHPQCAVALADEPRRARLAAEKKAKAADDQLARENDKPRERSALGQSPQKKA